MKLKLVLIFLIPIHVAAAQSTIEDLQRVALVQNPRIQAMEREADMIKRRIPQAGAPEDPKLKLGLNNVPVDTFSLTQDDMTSMEIGISQMLPLSGKLQWRERIAGREHMKAVVLARRERIEVLHMLRMAVYEIQFARVNLRVLGEIAARIRTVIDSEVAASKTGRGGLANVIKANIEYAMIDEEIVRAKQDEKEGIEKARYLLGGSELPEIGQLSEPVFAALNREGLVQKISQDNPDLEIARIDLDISRDEVSLKKSESFPDIEFGLYYMQRDDGNGMKRSDMITGMATFNVPAWFWKKNIPMVDEMRMKYEASWSAYRDSLNLLTARMESLLGRMEKEKSVYLLYRDRIIPQTEIAFEAGLARYRSGESEFMPVLDTARMMLQYSRDMYMAAKEYLAARSELHSLAGWEVLP